jgi:hypothetical protein
MKKIIVLFLLSLSFSSGAETGMDALPGEGLKLNRRKKDPFGLNVVAFGPVGLVSLTADCFITPKFALEAGGGFRDFSGDHAFTIGARYHVFGKTSLNITPYIGLYSVFHHNGVDLQSHGVYIPVGLHRIKKNHFCWSAEVAWQRNLFSGNGISGSFKIGYRF